MLLMDSISSFWYVEFLKEKTMKVISGVLESFIAEAERLTEKKLIRIRVDYKCEWDN